MKNKNLSKKIFQSVVLTGSLALSSQAFTIETEENSTQKLATTGDCQLTLTSNIVANGLIQSTKNSCLDELPLETKLENIISYQKFDGHHYDELGICKDEIEIKKENTVYCLDFENLGSTLDEVILHATEGVPENKPDQDPETCITPFCGCWLG